MSVIRTISSLVAGPVLLVACTPLPGAAQQARESGALHGYVREAETGEPIRFANVLVDEALRRQSDRDGYFSVPGLRAGEYRLRVRAFGYASLDTTVTLSSAPIELRLRSAPLEIAGVTAEAERARERAFETPEVSAQIVTPEQVRRVPMALEADLFRSLQALPGVVSPGALSGRLLVRGGSSDENLYLLDGYPVIHPYRLFGAFSAFHVGAVQDAEFYLAVPPARYGGHLSSVLDVKLREGNREQRTGTAALGFVSSSAEVEGPHAKGAWFVGARSTYLDVVTRELLDEEVPYRFYDLYAKSYADLSPSDRVSGVLFLGQDLAWTPGSDRDAFRDDKTWTNALVGLSWRRLLGGWGVYEQRLSASGFWEALHDGYSRVHTSDVRGDHRIGLYSLEGRLRLLSWPRHQIEAGYAAQRRTGVHRILYASPGSDEVPHLDLGYAERAGDVESSTLALYAQDDVTLSEALRLRLGLRGEWDGEGHSLQPRLVAKYLLSEHVALTAGAGLLRQRVHVLPDPDADPLGFPIDLWLAAEEPDVPVATAAHFVGGVEARLPYDLRARVEAYQKDYRGVLTIPPNRPSDRRFAIERFEVADGRARGVDLMLSRQATGPVRGWLGYSLASSTRTTAGERFAADPHPRQRFVAVGEIDPRGKWNFTGRFEAYEGIPYTPPVEMVGYRPFDFAQGRFLTGRDLPDNTNDCLRLRAEYLYGERNSARTGWSKRLDLGAERTWTDSHGREWALSLSVLNVLSDPPGIFRPSTGRAERMASCFVPVEVVKQPEYTFPAIPSLGIRVRF